MIQITGLFIYPIKSCRGISLREVELGPRGFLHDREFLVVDGEDRFMTQRNTPALATVGVALDGKDGFILTAPDAGTLRLTAPHLAASIATDAQRNTAIFGDEVSADDMGDEAAEWLRTALKQRCRLLRIGASYSRQVRPEKIAPVHRSPQGADISFTDAFPTLLTAEESLAELNGRLPHPIPMSRFRPNIVVRGGAPYEEDTWSAVRTETLVFGCASPNLRCIVTTTDQQTGARDGPEPLRTLATYRRAPDGSGVMFGHYLVHSGGGALRVGEVLTPER